MFDLHGISVPTIMFTPELMDQHIQWGRMDDSCDKCGHGLDNMHYNRNAEPGTLNVAMWLHLVPDEFKEFAMKKLEIAIKMLMDGEYHQAANEQTRLNFIDLLTKAIMDGMRKRELDKSIDFIDIKLRDGSI